MNGIFKVVTVIIFGFTALGIAALIILPSPWEQQNNRVVQQSRVVIPRTLDTWLEDYAYDQGESLFHQTMTARLPLGEGDVVLAVLNGNFYGNPVQEQFVAYRNTQTPGSPVYLTFIAYDPASQAFKRAWTVPTAAARPDTVTLDALDIIGDRSVSILLSGMNEQGDHVLTVFHMSPEQEEEERFRKIAEITIDGNITVMEVARSQAYQMGFGPGQSFTIAAHGRDSDSDNLMDQIEIIYAHNPASGVFEQRSRTRIPGAQIEQRRVRELLGDSRAFEEFITGLWHFVTPQGTTDRNQFIYFDPLNQQIIFFADETMQVFAWRNSIATRQGLHITSQNISISTIRRSIDIQLESLNGIRIRTTENLRPAFRGVAAPWDGSYRMAGRPVNVAPAVPSAALNAHLEARFDSPIGRIHFFPDGSYQILSGGALRQGKYAFFKINGQELLEFRSNGTSGPFREIFLVEGEDAARQNLTLLPVRINARGIERLNEGAISLTLVEDSL
ncbi:MAG: pallilysin-related adhesin [Treponema sp.]|nr:pallilysin-related adhesin [Treponema sp.]